MTRTETIDTLYSLTWASRSKEIADNIFNKHVLWSLLASEGKWLMIEGGGLHIEEPVMYKRNETFKAIGRGGTVSTNPTDAHTMTKWDWRTVAGSITRYSLDDFKNRGSKQMANIVERDINLAKKSCSYELTRQIYLDGTGEGGDEIDGLKNIVADDPTASGSYSTVGGISLSGNSWWENYYEDASSYPFATYGVERMGKMMNNCEDGADLIDIIITSKTLYEAYEAEVQGIQQVIPGEGTRNKIADLGFRNLWFKQVPLVFDKHTPDETHMWFLNTDTLRIARSDIDWFEMTDWKHIPNQVNDRVAQIIVRMNLICNNRRRNGVIFDFA